LPTFPLGHHAHLQRQANAQRIARLEPPKPITHHYAGYEHPDPVDLRGIPCLAKAVGGTIPGTQPEHRICR
jgi:hypothetical protein